MNSENDQRKRQIDRIIEEANRTLQKAKEVRLNTESVIVINDDPPDLVWKMFLFSYLICCNLC